MEKNKIAMNDKALELISGGISLTLALTLDEFMKKERQKIEGSVPLLRIEDKDLIDDYIKYIKDYIKDLCPDIVYPPSL